MSNIAVITGGLGGIGLNMVDIFCKLDWEVCIITRNAKKLDDSLKGKFFYVNCDFEKIESVKSAVKEIHSRADSIGALMLNAGAVEMATIFESNPSLVDRIFKINFGGHFELVRLLEPSLRKGGARVVATSSMAAHDPFENILIYGAAKAALEGAMRGLSKCGIPAFSVAPGAVETKMLRNLFNEEQLPKSKVLSPYDVAKVAVDLALGKREESPGSTVIISSPE